MSELALQWQGLNMPGTKDEKRTGATDLISVEMAALVQLPARFIQTKQPKNGIIAQLPQACHGSFRKLASGLSLNNQLLQPYGMRRDHAANLFRAAIS